MIKHRSVYNANPKTYNELLWESLELVWITKEGPEACRNAQVLAMQAITLTSFREIPVLELLDPLSNRP